MDNEIYNNLLNNRLLNDNSEIEKYEHALELLAETFSENDIVQLCSTLDDKTHDTEVMFGTIHLLESLSSELSFENTIVGVVNLYNTSPEWAKVIVYRCLNDDFSVKMIKKIISQLDSKIKKQFIEILEVIKTEDCERFGKSVDEILD